MVTSQTVPLTFGILVDRLQNITRYYTKRTSAFATQYCEKAEHVSPGVLNVKNRPKVLQFQAVTLTIITSFIE